MFRKIDKEECRLFDYEDIKLPRRATKYSAGYDFFVPYDLKLKPKQSTVVTTGVIWDIGEQYFKNENNMGSTWVLKLYPKSGLGFKYHLGLANTVGIIDADFKKQIMIKIVNNGDEIIKLKKGQGFAQGILEKCYFNINYDTQYEMEERNGGFGSTSNSKGE